MTRFSRPTESEPALAVAMERALDAIEAIEPGVRAAILIESRSSESQGSVLGMAIRNFDKIRLDESEWKKMDDFVQQ